MAASPRRPGAQRFDALSRLDLAPGEYRSPRRRVRRCAHGERLLVCDRSGLRGCPVVALEHRGRRDGRDADARPRTSSRRCCRSCRRRGASSRAPIASLRFFRIYQGTGRQDPLAPVQLQSTIVDARGAVVATETSTLDAGQFATNRTADHYLTRPARDARPGRLPPQDRDDDGQPGSPGAPCDSSSRRRPPRDRSSMKEKTGEKEGVCQYCLKQSHSPLSPLLWFLGMNAA